MVNFNQKLKFGSTTNSNMQNSMMVFTFSVLDHKQPFWVNLVSKHQISIQKRLELDSIKIQLND